MCLCVCETIDRERRKIERISVASIFQPTNQPTNHTQYN